MNDLIVRPESSVEIQNFSPENIKSQHLHLGHMWDAKEARTRMGIRFDMYNCAEEIMAEYYPLAIDELSVKMIEEPQLHHILVFQHMPFVVHGKKDLGLTLMLPNINCSAAALVNLKGPIYIYEANKKTKKEYRVFSGNNNLFGDYLELIQKTPGEIYHIKDKDPFGYLVLSRCEVFDNDDVRRPLELKYSEVDISEA